MCSVNGWVGASSFQQNAFIGLLVQFTPFSKNASNTGVIPSIDATICTSQLVNSPYPFV